LLHPAEEILHCRRSSAPGRISAAADEQRGKRNACDDWQRGPFHFNTPGQCRGRKGNQLLADDEKADAVDVLRYVTVHALSVGVAVIA